MIRGTQTLLLTDLYGSRQYLRKGSRIECFDKGVPNYWRYEKWSANPNRLRNPLLHNWAVAGFNGTWKKWNNVWKQKSFPKKFINSLKISEKFRKTPIYWKKKRFQKKIPGISLQLWKNSQKMPDNVKIPKKFPKNPNYGKIPENSLPKKFPSQENEQKIPKNPGNFMEKFPKNSWLWKNSQKFPGIFSGIFASYTHLVSRQPLDWVAF